MPELKKITAETPARASAGNGRPALMMAGQKEGDNMQSPIKPFKAPAAKAPWIGKNVLENAKAASQKASGNTKN